MKKTNNNPKIVVVTPIHNGLQHTLPYLKSVKSTGYANLEVIIVDDGSDDGSAEAIKKYFPETIVLPGDGNLWWTGATNLGVKEALKRDADYVFTINNDVTLHKDIFKSLIACSNDNLKTLIGCKIYYMNDKKRVWYFGGQLDSSIGDIRMSNGEDEDFPDREETGALTGMGVLVPIGAFDAIGLYDFKNFPHYLADSDFSLRAKAAGYKLMVDPDSKVYSDVGSSWLRKALKRPTPSFFWALFFKDRSPHSIKIRYRFNKRYWPKQKYRMLFRYYWLLATKIIRPNAIID